MSTDETNERFERKRKALDLKFVALKEEGDDTQAARNHMIASNEVADELGVFERSGAARAADHFQGDPPFEPRRDGFIIRTRSDALETKLNSVDIFDAILRMEKKLDRLEWIVSLTLAALVGLAIKLLL